MWSKPSTYLRCALIFFIAFLARMTPLIYLDSFILNYDQQMHNYFTNYYITTCFDTIVSSSDSLESITCQVTQVFQMQLLIIQFKIKMFHTGFMKILLFIVVEILIYNIWIVNYITNSCIWNTCVNWQSIVQAPWLWHDSVETCRSVIICEITVCISWFSVQINKTCTVHLLNTLRAGDADLRF